jgi:hypothetical protein
MFVYIRDISRNSKFPKEIIAKEQLITKNITFIDKKNNG